MTATAEQIAQYHHSCNVVKFNFLQWARDNAAPGCLTEDAARYIDYASSAIMAGLHNATDPADATVADYGIDVFIDAGGVTQLAVLENAGEDIGGQRLPGGLGGVELEGVPYNEVFNAEALTRVKAGVTSSGGEELLGLTMLALSGSFNCFAIAVGYWFFNYGGAELTASVKRDPARREPFDEFIDVFGMFECGGSDSDRMEYYDDVGRAFRKAF